MDFPRIYHSLIEWMLAETGIGDTALHVHMGLAILFLTRVGTRRRLETMVPLAAVIVAELINEVMDRLYWGAWQWDDTAVDIFHTLLWPVLISWGALGRSAFRAIFGRSGEVPYAASVKSDETDPRTGADCPPNV